MPGQVNCAPLPTARTRPGVLTWSRTPVAGVDVDGWTVRDADALVVGRTEPVGDALAVRVGEALALATAPVQVTPLSAKAVVWHRW